MFQEKSSSDLDGREFSLLVLALAGLFLVLYVLSLFGRPLFIPDEVRYAEMAREMIVHGNWIVPRLDGLLYFEKPPLGHWLNAIALVVFGENEFAVRIASALSAGITALMAYVLCRKFFESRATALLTVFIYLTCFEVQVVGTLSVLDTMFTAALNLGIGFMVLSAIAEEKPAQTRLMLLGGCILGLAFLAKGFLGFVLPGIVLLPWLLWEKKYAVLLKRSWLAVGAAIAIVLPWAIAIHIQQPDFWRYFVVVEHLQRFAAENAQHKAPAYYFLMGLPLVTFPWFFLLPAGISGLVAPRGERSVQAKSGIALMVLWAVVPFAFFSVASGKLITYILPCFLPFSILMAYGLRHYLARVRDSRRMMNIGLVFVSLVFLVALVSLWRAQFGSAGQGLYMADEMGRFYILAAVLGLGVIIPVAGMYVRGGSRGFLAGGLAIIPVVFALQFVLPDEVMQHKAPGAFLESLAGEVTPDTIVITNGSLVRAVSWHLKRDDVYVIQNKGETAYGLDAPDGAGRFLEPLDLASLLRQHASSNDVLIVCKNPCNKDTREFISANAEANSYGNFYSYLIRKSAPADEAEVN